MTSCNPDPADVASSPSSAASSSPPASPPRTRAPSSASTPRTTPITLTQAPSTHRKGRWTRAEHDEVLRVGGDAGPSASWERLRGLLNGDARDRSTAALKVRYAQLVRERTERERDEPRRAGQEEDLKVDEEDVSVDAVTRVNTASEQEDLGQGVLPWLVAALSASSFLQPSTVPSPAPWSLDEDAALLASMATPPLGPTTWTKIVALVRRVYMLGLGQGRPWGRSEKETRERWEQLLAHRAPSPLNWPDSVAPALTQILQRLTDVLQAELDVSNPAIAATMRRDSHKPPPGPLHLPVQPQPQPHKAQGLGRAAPPFPSRESPVSGTSALPVPASRQLQQQQQVPVIDSQMDARGQLSVHVHVQAPSHAGLAASGSGVGTAPPSASSPPHSHSHPHELRRASVPFVGGADGAGLVRPAPIALATVGAPSVSALGLGLGVDGADGGAVGEARKRSLSVGGGGGAAGGGGGEDGRDGWPEGIGEGEWWSEERAVKRARRESA
ncbi:hypothetical protein DMC30DRAFT_262858 [Rhodotorula diobovata]|uniref:Myb-like domain-containing protein n=1 Tax=Rhodotorula diobovata TaxID=5288 RepID=A0A5C5FVF7_9BASI|nr:hypothetical protein DMC30DRAFT_262858 [Rhodotorula diobovata]